MTLEEKRSFFGYKEPSVEEQESIRYADLESNYDNSKDWREEGAVGPVRNEYQFN